jgi:hypothetical protein
MQVEWSWSIQLKLRRMRVRSGRGGARKERSAQCRTVLTCLHAALPPSMAAGPVNKTREFEDDARAPPRTSAVATVREAMRLEGRTDGNAVGGTVRRSERAVTIGRPDPRWWLVPCFVCRLDFGSCAVLPWGSF